MNKAWTEVQVSDLDIGSGKVIWFVGERTQVPVDSKGKPIPMPREVRTIPVDAFLENAHFSGILNRVSPITRKSIFGIKNINDLYWTIKNMDAQTYLDNLEDTLPGNLSRNDKLALAKEQADKLKTFLFGGYRVHIDDIFHVPGVKVPVAKEEESKEEKPKRTRRTKKTTEDNSTLNLD